MYYEVNTKVDISRIPIQGCEIRGIRASRVLDPVLQVSENKNRILIEICAKLVNFACANRANFARFAVKRWGTLKEQEVVEFSKNRVDFT